jgi:hypothetical protein
VHTFAAFSSSTTTSSTTSSTTSTTKNNNNNNNNNNIHALFLSIPSLSLQSPSSLTYWVDFCQKPRGSRGNRVAPKTPKTIVIISALLSCLQNTEKKRKRDCSQLLLLFANEKGYASGARSLFSHEKGHVVISRWNNNE